MAAAQEPVEQIRERAAATSGSRFLDVTGYELGRTDPPGPPTVTRAALPAVTPCAPGRAVSEVGPGWAQRSKGR